MSNATDSSLTAARAYRLSDRELVGICRAAINQPVRASDIPRGVPELSPADLEALKREIGQRTIMSPVVP